MSRTVFFSWQADTATRIGRNLLREILEEIRDGIASDTNVAEALREIGEDSDTQGVAGQPPIVETIFRKIDAAAVFVADMTFVGKRIDGRPTPNPNVLIEYGWALKALGHQRIIAVMNAAYGEPSSDNLPFDLSHVRWPIQYNLSESATAETKAKEKNRLFSVLNGAIRASLETVPTASVEARPEFPAAEAKDGPARFRSKEEALGFQDGLRWPGGEKEVFLSPGAAMWLRLMPIIAPGKQWPPHELQKHSIQNNRMDLAPLLVGSGSDFLRAADGAGVFQSAFLSERDSQGDTIQALSVAFAFETGEVWSIDTNLLSHDPNVLPLVEGCFIQGIQNYARFLEGLGVQPPYRWVAGIVGIKGRYLERPPRYAMGRGPRCAADLIEVEGNYDGKESAATALLPFFKTIFEKCGMPRPDYQSQ